MDEEVHSQLPCRRKEVRFVSIINTSLLPSSGGSRPDSPWRESDTVQLPVFVQTVWYSSSDDVEFREKHWGAGLFEKESGEWLFIHFVWP